MSIGILFRCDDAGASPGTNRAILQCVTEGVGRNVGVMVPGPAFADAVSLFADIAHLCDLGLHLTLNSEWTAHGEQLPARWGPVLPAAAVPSLVYPDGTFRCTPMENHEAGASHDEMLAEAAAQLKRALQRLRVDYMDEHMGCGWLPGLRDRLRSLAHAHGVRYAMDAALRHLPELPDESPDLPPWTRLARRILAAPDGDYIVVTHPTFNDADARGMCLPDAPPGKIGHDRDLDRQMLIHPEVLDAVRTRGVRLLRYSDVLDVN